MTRPRAVLLDAGGVLLLPNPWVVASVLRAAGGEIALDDVRRVHYECTALMDARGDSDWLHYNRLLVERAGVPDRNFDDAVAAVGALYLAPAATLWNVVPDGVADQVAALRATGVAIAVVSNADGTVESLLRKSGLAFDIVIDSAVVGYAKPQPEIFGFALDKLGVAPADAVHVGDTAWADVVGARAAGVRPLHLDPFGDCPYPEGDHEHVRSLADVVNIATRLF
jgi:putative hydrolase of the HAD superfamily